MTREQINNLPEIKTFDELFNIQCEAAKITDVLDLMLIRQFYFLADICIFIIGPDAANELTIYKMSHENYYKFTENEQEYIHRYY